MDSFRSTVVVTLSVNVMCTHLYYCSMSCLYCNMSLHCVCVCVCVCMCVCVFAYVFASVWMCMHVDVRSINVGM